MPSVRVNVAVLSVADPSALGNVASENIVADRLTGAGHLIASFEAVRDSETAIRSQLVGWMTDPDIDIVIVLGDGEKTSAAIKPLVDQALPGFADLLRMLAFQEIGASAMLSTAEAARCGTTFIFVVPGNENAVKAALEKLILPQLDPATKPRNLIGSMPRLRDSVNHDMTKVDVAKLGEIGPSDVTRVDNAKIESARVKSASNSVPTPIAPEKTETGAGVKPKLPAGNAPAVAMSGQRSRQRTGVNVIARKVDDPTKPIELDKLERQLALSKEEEATKAQQAVAEAAEASANTRVTKPMLEAAPRPSLATRPLGSLHVPATPSGTAPVAKPLPSIRSKSSQPPPDEASFADIGDSTKPLDLTKPTTPVGAGAIGTARASSSQLAAKRAKPSDVGDTTQPLDLGRLPKLPPGAVMDGDDGDETGQIIALSPKTKPANGAAPSGATAARARSESASGATRTAPAASSSSTSGASSSASRSAAPSTSASRSAAASTGGASTAEVRSTSAAPSPHNASTSPAASGASRAPAAAPSSASRAPSAAPSSSASRPASAPASSASTSDAASSSASRAPSAAPSSASRTPSAAPSSSASRSASAPASSASTSDASGMRSASDAASSSASRSTSASSSASPSSAATEIARIQLEPVVITTKATQTAAGPAMSPAAPAPAVARSAEPEPIDEPETIETLDIEPDPVPVPAVEEPEPEPEVAASSFLSAPSPSKRRPTQPPPNMSELINLAPSSSLAELPQGSFVYPTKRASKAPLIIALLVLSAAIGGGAMWLVNRKPDDKPKQTEQVVLPAADPKVEVDAEAPAVAVVDIDAAQAERIAPVPTDAAVEEPPPATKPTTKPTKPTKPTTRPTTKPRPTTASTKPTTKPDTTEPPPEKPPEKPAGPAAEPGCEEVACVMEKYARPCCARFKPQGDTFQPANADNLSKPQIKAGVDRMKPRVIACAEQHQDAKGTVKVAISVDGEGNVTELSVTTAPDDGLGECVGSVMRKAKFAKTANGGSFTYPFVF